MIRDKMLARAGLSQITREDRTMADRRSELDEMCREDLGMAAVSVRAYDNCCTVQWPSGLTDKLVAVDHKDTLADARAMIAKAAGIEVKRVVKPEHRPSEETMAKLARMTIGEINEEFGTDVRFFGGNDLAASARHITPQSIVIADDVVLDLMPDGTVKWRKRT